MNEALIAFKFTAAAADLIKAFLENLNTFRSDTKPDSYFRQSFTLAEENGLK